MHMIQNNLDYAVAEYPDELITYGGGVGWGEVINGGFGMVLDDSQEASKRLASMLLGCK